jgi:hypothetical protein
MAGIMRPRRPRRALTSIAEVYRSGPSYYGYGYGYNRWHRGW